MKSTTKLLMAAVCGVFLASGVNAADIKEQTLRFAFLNVAEHPQGLGAKKFAELVAAKSGGKMQVKLFPGGQLGGDVQTVSALQGGTVDLFVLNSGILQAQSKEFAILDLPFLFNDYKEVDAVTDGPVGKQLADKLPPKGLISLGYWDLGFRNVTNSKHPITKLEDFAGLKLRVIQSPIYIDTFGALGSNPVPMPFPEVYTALEQKTVDGQENPFTTIEGSKFQEVQKYLSITRHIYNPQSFIMSKKSWDKLSKDEQDVITQAAKETQVYQRKVSRDAQDVALGNLKKSMTVNEIAPAELTRIRAKVKPVVDKFSAEAGPAIVKEMYADIEKVRGK